MADCADPGRVLTDDSIRGRLLLLQPGLLSFVFCCSTYFPITHPSTPIPPLFINLLSRLVSKTKKELAAPTCLGDERLVLLGGEVFALQQRAHHCWERSHLRVRASEPEREERE